jgi:hypothetical protein
MKAGGKQSETSVDFQQTTWCYIPEDGTLHNHCCENLNTVTSLTDLSLLTKMWQGIFVNAYALFKYGFFISHLSCKLDACRTKNSLHISSNENSWGRVLLEKIISWAGQKNFGLLWNPKVHYRVHKSPLLAETYKSSPHISCFLNLRVNVMLLCTLRSPTQLISYLKVSRLKFVRSFLSSCYMLRGPPICFLWVHHSNNIWEYKV